MEYVRFTADVTRWDERGAWMPSCMMRCRYKIFMLAEAYGMVDVLQ